jgi:hypothetical protein
MRSVSFLACVLSVLACAFHTIPLNAAAAPRVLLWDNDKGRTACDPDINTGCVLIGTEVGLIRALQANGITPEVVTQLPPSLTGYAAVYITLGWRMGTDQEGQITSAQQTELDRYIHSGGAVFLQGNDFARDSAPGSALMNDFGVVFNNDGNPDSIGTVKTLYGISRTFTEGMVFPYEYRQLPDNYPDDVLPGGPDPGDIIFNDQGGPGKGASSPSESGLAPGEFRGATVLFTIGFGYMKDGPLPSTKTYLMHQILGYFGLVPTAVDDPRGRRSTQSTWGRIKALLR